MGKSTTLSTFGTRALSQYLAFLTRSTLMRGLKFCTWNGPVPIGAFANSAQLLPAFSNAVGLTWKMVVST
jgi:hypothetical protein